MHGRAPVPTGVDPDDPAYVVNPFTGERFQFHGHPDDRTSDPLELASSATTNRSPLAEHVYPQQRETFHVNSGTLELSQRDVETMVSSGEETTVEAGTPHTWSNAGDEELHLTVRFEPALETEAFLLTECFGTYISCLSAYDSWQPTNRDTG